MFSVHCVHELWNCDIREDALSQSERDRERQQNTRKSRPRTAHAPSRKSGSDVIPERERER